jgi:hypothetical protein
MGAQASVTEDLATICPFCDEHHEAVTLAQGDVEWPADGDVSICFRCGQLCVFDRETRGLLRKPTKKEQRRFDRDENLKKLVAAWKITMRQ